MPEYTNNKESSWVKKILALASSLANRWLFSSSFLICLTQNVSKQFRVTDKYKRKNLPQNQWRNLLQNARTGAWSSSNNKFPLRKHCLLVMHDPDYPACTIFSKGLMDPFQTKWGEKWHPMTDRGCKTKPTQWHVLYVVALGWDWMPSPPSPFTLRTGLKSCYQSLISILFIIMCVHVHVGRVSYSTNIGLSSPLRQMALAVTHQPLFSCL